MKALIDHLYIEQIIYGPDRTSIKGQDTFFIDVGGVREITLISNLNWNLIQMPVSKAFLKRYSQYVLDSQKLLIEVCEDRGFKVPTSLKVSTESMEELINEGPY